MFAESENTRYTVRKRTVFRRSEILLIERKSEFIGQVAPVSSEREALDFLEEIRARNRKANHNCFAYIIGEGVGTTLVKNDDGEPSGTAGTPILDVLQKEGLTDVICVVTRYFGGILLGTGGLVRTYSKAASLAVAEAGIKTFFPARRLKITLDYSHYGKLSFLNVHVAQRNFAQNIELTVIVKEEYADKYIAEVIDLCSGAVVVEFIQNELFDFG